jgi:hypothetical protein
MTDPCEPFLATRVLSIPSKRRDHRVLGKPCRLGLGMMGHNHRHLGTPGNKALKYWFPTPRSLV